MRKVLFSKNWSLCGFIIMLMMVLATPDLTSACCTGPSCTPHDGACTDVKVSAPVIDTGTQGEWSGTYGSCFYLIPNPENPRIENPIGPDFFSEAPDQYSFDNCYGGQLYDDNKVDWRIFRQTPEGNAFAFSLAAAEDWEWDTDPVGGQWNPCEDDFRGATWDSDLANTDPLVVEVKVNLTGKARITYYFLDADNVCREEQLNLYVNGELKTNTPVTISAFSDGKFVAFDLDCLQGETVIKLEAKLLPQSSCVIEDPVVYYGVNSHISGVFIDCEPQAPMCFEVNSAKASTKSFFTCDSLELAGSLKLSDNAKPFDPSTDDVTVTLWGDSFTIPAGSFKKADCWWGTTSYRYCGKVTGIGYVTLDINLKECTWELKITGGANTKTYINSQEASVGMTIGSNVGTDSFQWSSRKSFCGYSYAQFCERYPTLCCRQSGSSCVR